MFWLCKTEPSTYSIDDLRRDRINQWEGVRNYQARNYLRQMKVGEQVLIYHSNEPPIGVTGVAEVSKEAYADWSQFDKRSEYFDPKAKKELPRWFAPDLCFREKFLHVVTLKDIRESSRLQKMLILAKGSRLSVTPVEESEFKEIVRMSNKSE